MSNSAISKKVVFYVTDTNLSFLDRLTETLRPRVNELIRYDVGAPLSEVFDADRAGLVILAGAGAVPNGTKKAVYDYMSAGGRVLTLGGPLFSEELHAQGDKWLVRSDYIKALLDEHKCEAKVTVIDTAAPDIFDHIRRDSNQPDMNVTAEQRSDECCDGYVLVDIPKCNCHWELYRSNVTAQIDRADTLSLCAKAADSQTNRIGICLVENDGSSWIADISLTEQWEQYHIPAFCFKRAKANKSDRSKPDLTNLKEILIGFAEEYFFAPAIRQTYCFAEVSLSYFGLPEVSSSTPETRIEIDSVSPIYELYPVNSGVSIAAHTNQVFVQARDYVLPKQVFSCYPHRQSMGYGNKRPRRFVPLINIFDAKGLLSGYAAWINMFVGEPASNGALEGSMIACFSATSDDFYDENGIAAVAETVGVMTSDCFLLEGGSNEFTYMTVDDKQMICGASCVSLRGVCPQHLSTKITLSDENGTVCEYTDAGRDRSCVRDGIYTAKHELDFAYARPRHVAVCLIENGQVIDKIEHDIHYWQPKPVSERKFVYTENGHFMRDGKIINFFGVNFAPTYRAGISSAGLWMGREDYDPEIIGYDLARVKNVGFNALSLWTSCAAVESCNNMLDLLRRCEEQGLFVDMALSGNTAYPLKPGYDINKVEKWLHRLHFHENDMIYAYDIAWEERVGTYDGSWHTQKSQPGSFIGRKAWDADWTDWVRTQYGSLEHAEQLWEVTLPRTEEGYLYVSDETMNDESGVYKKMLSAYYRFFDDQIAAKLGAPVREMKALAPDQLFSFRMSMAGCGLKLWGWYKPSTFCFDYQSLAPAVDFLAPEGYTLVANDPETLKDHSLQIPIANAYARYTKPDTPLVWKEFGDNVWSGFWDSNFRPDPYRPKIVADYYECTLRNAYQAYTSAIFCWWSSTGYRRDENGDCGIFEPDGSDRLLTPYLRRYAPLFINQRARPKPDVTITVERDNQVGGMYGIYEAIEQEMRRAVDDNKFPWLINNRQTAYDQMLYADEVYQEAVGGTEQTGIYPLRYVNGLIKCADVRCENGKTLVRVTVTNTKQSIWRANSVCVAAWEGTELVSTAFIDQEVGYLKDATVQLEVHGQGKLDLRLQINSVAFGPRYSVSV